MVNSYDLPLINARFFEVFKSTGLSQKKFGFIFGLSQNQVSNILSGKRGITPMLVKLLRLQLNVNPKWLHDGVMPMFLESSENTEAQIPILADIPAGPWENWIDSYAPGAGDDYIDVPEIKGRNLFGIRVKGDSMEPNLRERDILIIDPHKRFKHGIAVVRHKWGYKIRLVKRSGSGSYMLWPTNIDYDEEEIYIEENTRLYVPVKVISMKNL